MSDSLDKSYLAGELSFDRRLMLFLNVLRGDVVHLLQPGQPHPLTQADVSCALATLKTVADTALVLAERERSWSLRDQANAQAKLQVAETERVLAEKGKIQAETLKFQAQKK